MGLPPVRVLLFSGGIESTALACWLRPERLLMIDYGQIPAAGERRAAHHVASELGLDLDEIEIDASSLGAGDMVGRAAVAGAGASEAWPFRNQFLITLAAMRYADDDLREILIGTIVTDTVHPDGRPEFIAAMDALIRIEAPDVRVRAPAHELDAPELVRRSGVSRNLLGWTFSCHRGTIACGQCRGCTKTMEVFAALDSGGTA